MCRYEYDTDIVCTRFAVYQFRFTQYPLITLAQCSLESAYKQESSRLAAIYLESFFRCCCCFCCCCGCTVFVVSFRNFILCFACLQISQTNILCILCKIILIYDQLTCDRRWQCVLHQKEEKRQNNPCLLYAACSAHYYFAVRALVRPFQSYFTQQFSLLLFVEENTVYNN